MGQSEKGYKYEWRKLCFCQQTELRGWIALLMQWLTLNVLTLTYGGNPMRWKRWTTRWLSSFTHKTIFHAEMRSIEPRVFLLFRHWHCESSRRFFMRRCGASSHVYPHCFDIDIVRAPDDFSCGDALASSDVYPYCSTLTLWELQTIIQAKTR